jgi:hypothetical protein
VINLADLIIYDCSSNKNTVDKVLTSPITISNVKPYEPLDELEGYIIIDYTPDKDGYRTKNYAEYLGNYYFITDRELLIGGKMKLRLRMDVLMSFSASIKNCPAIASRSTIGNPYIFDPMIPTQSYEIVKTYDFGFEFQHNGTATDYCYVMVTFG